MGQRKDAAHQPACVAYTTPLSAIEHIPSVYAQPDNENAVDRWGERAPPTPCTRSLRRDTTTRDARGCMRRVLTGSSDKWEKCTDWIRPAFSLGFLAPYYRVYHIH